MKRTKDSVIRWRNYWASDLYEALELAGTDNEDFEVVDGHEHDPSYAKEVYVENQRRPDDALYRLELHKEV